MLLDMNLNRGIEQKPLSSFPRSLSETMDEGCLPFQEAYLVAGVQGENFYPELPD